MGEFPLSMPLDNGDRHDEERNWRTLRFFNFYRLLLAVTFAIAAVTGGIPPLGQSSPQIFLYTSLSYLALSISAFVIATHRRPGFRYQMFVQVLLDILFLTVMMHASGGIPGGLGMLLVVTVANGSMVSEGRTAGLFAALATLAVIVEQSYNLLVEPSGKFSYPQAGMLGLALFATAILSRALVGRLQESEALAARRGIDLANMAELTDYIIQQMQTGVLVVTPDNDLRLMNDSARRLLDIPPDIPVSSLRVASPELAQRLRDWQAGDSNAGRMLEFNLGNCEVFPHFIAIGSAPGSGGTLIYLENASRVAEQAQRFKLAALGRLTAGIAHEIRNPLGAISHAGQLLAESPALPDGDRRLTEIVAQQAKRINTIVENVLQLGRRDASQAVTFELIPWLEQFIEEYRQAHSGETRLTLRADTELPPTVHFDPSHLRQIITNLTDNAFKHGGDGKKVPLVELHVAYDNHQQPYLEVCDHGPGVPLEHQSKLFEPFFSTGNSGTGLGLYISRELAQCNNGRLNHYSNDDQGACFRIAFGATERPFS